MGKNNWKELQSKKQRAKKTKIALAFLALILSLLVLSQIVKLTQTLFSPWRQESAKEYLWNGDFNLNFLVRSKEISLVSFNPKEQKITIIDIPPSTFLEVAGRGRWQLSSIYQLGEGEGGKGGMFLQDSLSSFFGLPIDGFLDFSGDNLIEEFRGSPFSLFSLLSDLKTNLTLYELIRLKVGLDSVRFDKITRINLEDRGVLEKFALADGTTVYGGEDTRIDSILSGIVDPVIKAEHKTIAVFNTTSYPGLAQKAARLITNIGGDVIIVSTSQQSIKKTVVVGGKSKTLSRLWQIFGKFDNIEPGETSSRAQINVFLGEDFAKKL